MAKRPGKPGKRRQSFTQRDLQRALRSIKAEQEQRTVIVRRDGSIELAPVGKGHDSEEEGATGPRS